MGKRIVTGDRRDAYTGILHLIGFTDGGCRWMGATGPFVSLYKQVHLATFVLTFYVATIKKRTLHIAHA